MNKSNKLVKVSVKRYKCTGCGKLISVGVCCMGCSDIYCVICKASKLQMFYSNFNIVKFDIAEHNLGHNGLFCFKCVADPPNKIQDILEAYQKVHSLSITYHSILNRIRFDVQKQEDIISKELEKIKAKRSVSVEDDY